MANTILALEAANLFVGDHDPRQGNHLLIQNLKFPRLEENYAEHVAGGAPVGIRIDTHIMPFDVTFALGGWQPDIMSIIGDDREDRQRHTMYGALRNKRNNKIVRVKAVIQGRLSSADPQDFRRGDFAGSVYAINGITHYHLTVDKDEIIYYDFFRSMWRLRGRDVLREVNRALAIQSAGAVGQTT